MDLDLELAQRVVQHCLTEAKARFAKPVCVAICDANGFLMVFSRAEGAPLRSIAISQQKAYTAARMGQTTTAFLERLRREDVAIGYFCDPLMTALPGGSLLEDSDCRVMGAIGISGLAPSEDQLLADAGSGVIQRIAQSSR